jgi:putative colanic acid biosynthesis acetyltransferase WcaF
LRRPLIARPITIGDHCWIAAESMVMPGINIAEGSVIGARSLVTKDMPSWSVCAGHPCVAIGPRRLAPQISLPTKGA